MRAAYQTYTARLGGETLPPMAVDYEDEIRSYPVWVAESEDTLVGGLVLMPEAGFLTVANVAVHPRFQGKGLGRGLMTFAEEEARRRGYRELHLATHVLLTENGSLYAHLGWVETSRDDDRVYMRKRLA
jgi:GNAT superfamily N-acetyltransferase